MIHGASIYMIISFFTNIKTVYNYLSMKRYFEMLREQNMQKEYIIFCFPFYNSGLVDMVEFMGLSGLLDP